MADSGEGQAQYEEVKALFVSYGDLTFHEVAEAYEAEYGKPILQSSVHGRCADLRANGVIDDTGNKGAGPHGRKNTKWGLVTGIPKNQMEKNLVARRGPGPAIKFTRKIARTSVAVAIDFLDAWAENEWDLIRRRWPDFEQLECE